MSGPITNFELGKMQHREYKVQASRLWGQNVTNDDQPAFSKIRRLVLVLSSAALTTLLIVQMLVF